MPNEPKRLTAYASYVYSNLPARIESGGGVYNYHEAADLVGLKPTQHFKRRVSHLVAEGRLMYVPCFTPRGGIETRITTPTNSTQEHPF